MLRVMAALLVLLAAAVAPRPAAAGAVEDLGAAWRAFQESDYELALRRARALDRSKLENPDYVHYIAGQSAYFAGELEVAGRHFDALAADRDSRFRNLARWRRADTLWRRGQHAAAARAYTQLIRRNVPGGDDAIGVFRIAEAAARAGNEPEAMKRFRAFRQRYPAHVLEPEAERKLVALGGAGAAALSPAERIDRARRLTDARGWHEAIAELSAIDPTKLDHATDLDRQFATAMTLFSMRRQYKRAGDILLGIYKELGKRADEALFHGARALSRADFDEKAIVWYQRVVTEYPRSRWAHEAAFLAGWLEFNLGNYEAALPLLADMRKRYRKSRFVDEAIWYQGMSHYFLGQHEQALAFFAELSRLGGPETGGKGDYWHARSQQKLGRKDEAVTEYRALVGRFPFSWYSMLARSRLLEAGVEIGPFGDEPRKPDDAPRIATEVDESLARDPLIRRADELIAAGLEVEAGHELRRGERGFLRRHDKPRAMAMLLDRYRKAHNFNRPWMLAVVHGGTRALDAPPKGPAKVWWHHAYPLAYGDLVERYRSLGGAPPYYLQTIMRKESGFDPHTQSYANALGLMQMIPPTTRRVVRALGIDYTDDLLFDPELNIKTGSWYIGRLLRKFKGQMPIGAGSFNSGPGPVMRWLELHGDHPMDEFIELVSYSQTRNYMRRVPETYARYLYLYEGKVYEQPLVVDADYVKNELTY